MDREYLFKGKKIIDKKWAISICPDGVMHSGTVGEDFIESTVEAFTGLYDMDGTRIFTGDIVEYKEGKCYGVVGDGAYHMLDGTEIYGPHIDWKSQDRNRGVNWAKLDYRPDLLYWLPNIAVIGNIHDNDLPEAVKKLSIGE